MGDDRHPTRIELAEERRRELVDALREFYRKELDEELSSFRAERLLEFFLRTLGPPVYNQAIRDAHAFLQEKLADMEGEVYEPVTPWRPDTT